jgi:hypothetical protein
MSGRYVNKTGTDTWHTTPAADGKPATTSGTGMWNE